MSKSGHEPRIQKPVVLGPIEDGRNGFDVLFWSGGKDSMAMLHIMRSMGIDLPLIFFKEPWQPIKYKFHNKFIEEWNLLVHTWHPRLSNFQQTDDEFEVQNYL